MRQRDVPPCSSKSIIKPRPAPRPLDRHRRVGAACVISPKYPNAIASLAKRVHVRAIAAFSSVKLRARSRQIDTPGVTIF